MTPSRPASRLVSGLCKQQRQQSWSQNIQRRYLSFRSDSPYVVRRQQHFYRSIVLVTAAGSLATIYTWYTGNPLVSRDGYAETALQETLNAINPEKQPLPEGKAERINPEDLVFESARKPKANASKEQTRDQISSQHLQVRKSLENPGVWCWGTNNGKVAAPDAKESLVKAPRWLRFFEGSLLRDLKVTQQFGAAISEDGDLLQWGSAYSAESRQPVPTLKGKNLISVALSKDRILALSANGKVYSMAVSLEEQTLGPKPMESSWLPFMSSRSLISYRQIKPTLSYTERISHIASGDSHAVLLTTSGRVFTFASGNEEFPSRGQLGVPGLTWFSRPKGPYDTPHEVTGLHGFKVTSIAAGDNHSVALDNKGRVFSWGDNFKGQLGIGDTSKDTTYFDAPALVPMTRLYAGTAQKPHVTHIYAGGNTTFFNVDATRVAVPEDEDNLLARRSVGRITADTWACGHGIWGQLGNGRWTHVQSLPTKIAPLSGLFEYDESARRAIPIRVRALSVGGNHVAATLDNVTYTSASDSTGANDTNWGADVLFFGNNEFYQLGTGRRNNVTTPTYIQPLDRVAEVREGKRPKEETHRFHATPMSTVVVGGRARSFEQRVVCGRGVTAVYSGI